MRARSDSAPLERVVTPVHDGDKRFALISELRRNCQRAAVTYVNNLVTDRPETVSSCTFYRSGTLVVTRPEEMQEVPRHIDALTATLLDKIVVSRNVAADRSGSEQYDLVHVIDQPALRVLFVHIAEASDSMVRAAAVSIVNDDAEINTTVSKPVVGVDPPTIPSIPAITTTTVTGEVEVLILHEKSESPPKRTPQKKSGSDPPYAVIHVDRRTDADDLESGDVEPGAWESPAAGLARRCVLL